MFPNYLKAVASFLLLAQSGSAIINELASLAPTSPLMVPGTVTTLEQTLLAPKSPITKDRIIDTALKTGYLTGQVLNKPPIGDINEPLPDVIDSPNIIKASPAQIDYFTRLTGISASDPEGGWGCEFCNKYAPTCTVVSQFHAPATDNTGYILKCDEEKVLYVNFRGARSLLNIVQMNSLDLVDYPAAPDAKVHRGYLQSTNEVRSIILGQLASHLKKYPDYNVMFIGHSFGGPLSYLMALEALKEQVVTNKNAYIFTLGSPRIGNYAFAKYSIDTGISIYRAVHSKDVVPHGPNIIDGYVHAGIEIWERPDYTYICNFAIETSFCSDMLEGHATSFEDHLVYFGLRYPVKKELF